RFTASAAPPSRGRWTRWRSRARSASARRWRPRGPPILPSRSCAATSWACRRGPRSAGCWRRSPRSGRRARSPRERKRRGMSDEAGDRFAGTAERLAALQYHRASALAGQVRRFVSPRGDERALDAGCGAGALTFALAAIVAEVVGVDLVPELLEQARARAA